MLPLGFMVPAVVLLLIALYVTAHELAAASNRRRQAGFGPLLIATGEGMMIVGGLAVFLQGWIAGLVLVPMGAFVLFLGGAVLFFVGMGVESRHAARR